MKKPDPALLDLARCFARAAVDELLDQHARKTMKTKAREARPPIRRSTVR
jgi:hypothetical protein